MIESLDDNIYTEILSIPGNLFQMFGAWVGGWWAEV